MKTDLDHFMRLALDLSRKARGRTFPNPLVGALVVKGGRIVGQGFHRRAGGPHAEIYALRQAGSKSHGASLFCTFEPCAHYGRTGPCVEKIIQSGIKEVFVGMIDPNPLTKGKGVRTLQEAGIRVRVGFLKKEIRRLNEAFISAMERQRPLVTIKIAQSLDGKTTANSGPSKWITGEASRDYSHRQRRFFDAIMVGINTVLKDDPGLEPHGTDGGHRLTKVIIDTSLKIPLEARLLKTKQPVFIAAVKKNKLKEDQLFQRGARVVYTRSDKGRVDLSEFLAILNTQEIRHVLVEGGSELIGSLVDQRLADKAVIFIAPKIIGGKDSLSSVGGEGISHLALAVRLEKMVLKKIGEDILIEGDLKYKQAP